MQEQQTTAAAGPVTLDDVRNALGETSALDTNASKIRFIIGRGSFATIQKHLETLRTQLVAAVQPQAATDTPIAPADLVGAVWSAAWASAQVLTLARLEKLSAERDGLQATTDAQASDLSSLTVQLDTLEAQAQAAATALTTAQAAAAELAAATAAEAAAQALALTAAQAEIAHVTEAAAHAAELAALTAQVERQALQSAIDRMHDQLGELKALHIVAATTAQPKPADAKKE